MSVLPTGIAAPTGGYEISRSVRTRQSASAYFNRTAGVSPTSNQKGTFSFWIKRGLISYGTEQWLFSAGSTSLGCYFTTGDLITLEYFGGLYIRPAMVFRDPSAWYHIVAAIDSTQATASNRTKIYVNGVQVTTFNTYEQYPTQNATFNWMASGQACYINQISSGGRYFDGYHTDFNYIDGQQLTPSDFGETDTTTGVWKPKRYAGTYGTNGFYLNFSDNSAATAAAIGKDSSGNGNNWTPNNISVTSGVTYDSMLDVPTMYADGGNGRGNYAVLNPAMAGMSSAMASGNLQNASGSNIAVSTIGFSSGKFAFQAICQGGTNEADIGFLLFSSGGPWASATSYSTYRTGTAGAVDWYTYNGNLYNETSLVGSYGSFGAGDKFQMFVDADAGNVYLAKNDVLLNSGNPVITGKTGKTWYPYVGRYTAGGNVTSIYVDFGQNGFNPSSILSGFNALNTQNLPDATIKQGNAYFDVSTWTGDQAARTITNSGAFQPDLIWTKSRSDAESHRLHDAVRGGNGSVLYELNSNETAAEGTDTLVSGVASNGFTIASGTNSPNITGRTYVGWQWKAGGSAVSNTNGSITSSVSAGATQGFSVVTYTGNGTTGATVGHGLGVKPAFMIFKYRGSSIPELPSWFVYHQSYGATKYTYLNSTAAADTSSVFLNDTEPTSSLVTLGNAYATNYSGANFVAYCFAEVAGYSKFGSYTGNNSTDGPFVYLGFRPRFVMFKDSSANGVWMIMDSARNTYNVFDDGLAPNNSNAESSYSNIAQVDFLSNGFKIRADNANQYWNNISSNTYIYAAFAENPFKYSLAR